MYILKMNLYIPLILYDIIQTFWSIYVLNSASPPQPFKDLALVPPNPSSSPPQPFCYDPSYHLNTENPTLKFHEILIEHDRYQNNILDC